MLFILIFIVVILAKMKCLLCSSKFKDQKALLDHYFSYHNIDVNNCFFQKLFQVNNKTLLRNCVRCSEFLTSEKHKPTQDFLKHYEDGKNIPFEQKPLDILKLSGLLIYSIDFQKHNDFYDFYNCEKCADDFLNNVKYKFKSNEKNSFKCSFYIENKQNSVTPNLQSLIDTRYWTAETYVGKYFNDFIFSGLRQDILEREIVNNMSGSAWYFKRFIYLAVKVLDLKFEISN